MDKNNAEQKRMNTKLLKRTFKDEYKKFMNIKKILIDAAVIFISFLLSDYLVNLLQIKNKICSNLLEFIIILIFIIISDKLVNYIYKRNSGNDKK